MWSYANSDSTRQTMNHSEIQWITINKNALTKLIHFNVSTLYVILILLDHSYWLSSLYINKRESESDTDWETDSIQSQYLSISQSEIENSDSEPEWGSVVSLLRMALTMECDTQSPVVLLSALRSRKALALIGFKAALVTWHAFWQIWRHDRL